MSLFHAGYTKKEIRSRIGAGHVHFVGIGGVSMSALARLLVRRGCHVTGSDRCADSFPTLVEAGIFPRLGHDPAGAASAGLVVYSLAVPEDDPDLAAARRAGVPAVSRAELLGAIAEDYSPSVGISGSHGKSTSTAMLDRIFTVAGVPHTTLLGADAGYPLPEEAGALLFESCEYRDSFLFMLPDIGVYLNAEWDHADYFPSPFAVEDSFFRAASGAGRAVLYTGDPALSRIASRLPSAVTVGEGEENVFRIGAASAENGYFSAALTSRDHPPIRLSPAVPGRHQIANAASVAAAALLAGIDPGAVEEGIRTFPGISRRCEWIGTFHGRDVYYDYAHHPTEITALIGTLRAMGKEKITLVFRPHTYSRTKAFFEEFVRALSSADNVILCDIFAAREAPIPGVSSEALGAAIGEKATFAGSSDAVFAALEKTEGTIVLTGAGDLCEIRKKISSDA